MRNAFYKIKLSQLQTLCNILADTDVRQLSNIKRKYSETALAFDETLALLENLKILKNNSEELSLSKSFSFSHISLGDFKKRLIPFLFSANSDISDELRLFLLNFQTENNKTFFRATELQKLKYSDTRNLLLELEFILTEPDNPYYFINPEFIGFFLNHFSRQELSPETLKRKQAEKDSLGLAAELAVIDFEIKRLTDISVLPNEIEHTAKENVLAGYDIKSFENNLDSHLKRIYRFIEVKAVSIQDYNFYWSRNEMEIAKVYGELYYLYLLPVNSCNTFDFEKLIIKRNPFKSIYSNDLDWKKEEESISFSKIHTTN